ncbi:MAG: sulfatase-like hydrolase/transferase [Thermoleophilaceae bacterium]|nr:sulfatase-like hydrolase/transferase [Thermoleophilaceae bacterium]
MVLVGFAIAQPAFDVISKTPEFFALRESSRTEVILFALVMGVGIPAALLVLELLAGLAGRSVARGLHLGLLAVLSALFAAPLVQGIASDVFGFADRAPSGWLVLAGAALVGIAVALAYTRFQLVRTYLFVLTPAPLVFLVLFLTDAPTGRVVLPPVPAVTKPAPVVMLVFDEFPVASLMDARQQIDAERYPNFAALGRSSTWYRRTTTVSDLTTSAVPAILTGTLPPPGTPPTASEQPRNLFTLLRKSHRLRAAETFTSMCPAGPCGDTGLGALPRRTLASVGDGVEIVAHAAAPPDLEHWLGELGEGVDLGDAVDPFPRLISDLKRTDQPELHYAHMLLPHYPWTRLPSGRFYERAAPLDLPRGFQAGAVQRWDPDPWLVRQAWHRHLLQVAYLDRMLGRLLRRLRAVGMYDRSLVVAVADHGVSFAPGGQMRDVTPSNAQDIAFVPLFIKAPGQRQGAVIDEPTRTTDILPTIMEILGGRVPWRIEGRSLTGRQPAPRPSVTVTSSRLPPVTTSATELHRRLRDALERRIRMFGTGSDGPDLVDREHHPEWIGRRLGDRGVRLGGPAAVRIQQRGQLERVSSAPGFVPALLTGKVLEHVPVGRELVLTLNGRVAAVVPVNPWWTGPPRFSAIVPERLLAQGANSVRAFWTR